MPDRSVETVTDGTAVHVWLLRRDHDPAAPSTWSAHLRDGEEGRAGGFRDRDAADAFRWRRSALRRTVGGLLGCAPVDVPLLCVDGRPELDGSPWRLSQSGTRGWTAVAAACGRPVGVDVEGRTAFGPAELELLIDRLPAPERRWAGQQADPAAAFLRCWTLREAVVKAVGAGMALGWAAVELDPDAPRLAGLGWPGASGPGDWHLEALAAPDGLTASVAVGGGPDARVLVRGWDHVPADR